MRLVVIIVLSLGFVDPRYTANRSTRKWIQSFSIPWVGVLSHQESKFSVEAITGITLIKVKLGLSNAYDVARITKTNIKNTTKAMFLALEGAVRYATVTDYVIHPEYNEATLNTIALVYLDYDERMFKWVLMDWPTADEQMSNQLGSIYAFGYVDDHEVLEQVMHTMEFVDLRQCKEFYKQGDLDSQWMTPTEIQCFRKKFTKDQCVFETGMTLAVHHLWRWKLLGLSVLGPGCALPARFIDFARYVPWVKQQTSLWVLNEDKDGGKSEICGLIVNSWCVCVRAEGEETIQSDGSSSDGHKQMTAEALQGLNRIQQNVLRMQQDAFGHYID